MSRFNVLEFAFMIKLQTKKGLSESQIKKLIYYSNHDPKIKRFTHDYVRFRNKKSFDSWINDDTRIFTLTNTNDDLLGIIWIKPKINKYSKYQHTFAIRIYKPIRGKGYSYDFAKNVLSTLKTEGLWLSTNIENIAAIKLYNKLAFKQIGKENDQIIMELGF
jgi:RimJ/RimL family protein N-acetyltransferase